MTYINRLEALSYRATTSDPQLQNQSPVQTPCGLWIIRNGTSNIFSLGTLYLLTYSFEYSKKDSLKVDNCTPPNKDGVKVRAPKAKNKAEAIGINTKAKAVVHKAKAKDKVINRDQGLRQGPSMTNQHNIILYDVNIYR